jgi:hypothetical protein
MAKKNLKISDLKYEIYHNIEQTLEVLQQYINHLFTSSTYRICNLIETLGLNM